MIHLTTLTEECGITPANLGIEAHEGTTTGENVCENDPIANTIKVK